MGNVGHACSKERVETGPFKVPSMKSSWVSRERRTVEEIIENDNWKKTWQKTCGRIQSVWFEEYKQTETIRFSRLMILNLYAASTQCIEYN